jgi:hypothetical protein
LLTATGFELTAEPFVAVCELGLIWDCERDDKAAAGAVATEVV